jgi:hypothetical protein
VRKAGQDTMRRQPRLEPASGSLGEEDVQQIDALPES